MHCQNTQHYRHTRQTAKRLIPHAYINMYRNNYALHLKHKYASMDSFVSACVYICLHYRMNAHWIDRSAINVFWWVNESSTTTECNHNECCIYIYIVTSLIILLNVILLLLVVKHRVEKRNYIYYEGDS